MQVYHLTELHIRLITGTLIGIGAIGLFLIPNWLFVIIVLGLLARILIVEWPRLFKTTDRLFWLIPLYPVLPFLLIIYLQLYGYDILNLMMFCVVAAHDAGSYLVGKYFGRHPLAPNISPNKTWEGFAGGFVLSFIFSLIFFGSNSVALIIGSIIPLILSINFASLAGDLFESLLKRRAGLKDAGRVLPGHGGILDRIDGLLFAAVVVFIARNYIRLLLN